VDVMCEWGVSVKVPTGGRQIFFHCGVPHITSIFLLEKYFVSH
jgi:hypothetical protein